MNALNALTGFYPVTKTLPFKLKPVGKTLENLQQNHIVTADEELAEDFAVLKEMANKIHKQVIDDVLSGLKLKLESEGNLDSLEEYASLLEALKDRNTEVDADLDACRHKLYRQVADAFSRHDWFPKLDKKELVTELMSVQADGPEAAVVKRFKKFTSYLTGYNKARMNMYSPEGKENSIPYRIVAENFPDFYTNIGRWTLIRETLDGGIINEIQENMQACLDGMTLDEVFCIDNYNMFLTQVGIDRYNTLLGGYNEEKNHMKGINEYVYHYNNKKDGKSLPKLNTLKKQISSDRMILSWVSENISNARQMAEAIQTFHHRYVKEIAPELPGLLLDMDKYDDRGIYLSNKEDLKNMSIRLYGKWNVIENELVNIYSRTVPPRRRKESEDDFYKRVQRKVSKIESFTLRELNNAMMAYGKDVRDYFRTLGAVNTREQQMSNHFAVIDITWQGVNTLLSQILSEEKEVNLTGRDKMAVKNYLDAVQTLKCFVRPLRGTGREESRDGAFYDRFDVLWEVLDQVTPLYNRVRNFVTRKPYSVEKIKMNFNNSVLLQGWSTSKIRDYRNLLLRRGGRYYLAILEKEGVTEMMSLPLVDESTEAYERLYYDQLGGASKMLPKVFFAESNKDLFRPSDEILDIRQRGSYKAGPSFNEEDLYKYIDFFKSCVRIYPKLKDLDWQWKDTREYRTFKEFTDSFTGRDYVVYFERVGAAAVDRMVDEGRMYLFLIDKRDWSEYAKGKKSLNALYFEMLFHPENLRKGIYKLSGGGEMFYRPASLHPKYVTHPAGQPIANKRPDVAEKRPYSTFAYDLIKDRRYTRDAYSAHFVLSINYGVVEQKGMPVTMKVRQLIRQGAFKHVMGIHRGEHNLLYVTVTDIQGRIVEQKSLNIIDSSCGDTTCSVDYNDLLMRRASRRDEQRKDWQTIDQIKDIKKGYLGQAVSVITDMIIKYQSLVVLEALGDNFVRSRAKIEKNIYQTFEQQLINKLSFLVKKDFRPEEPGGLLNAFQLTDKIDSSMKVFQNGIVFYVPAAYTANICPQSGFVNFFQLQYENMDNTKAFFDKFRSIRYCPEKDCFQFAFNYADFTAKAEGTREQWVLNTSGQRIRNAIQDGQRRSETISLTAEFKQFWTRNGIDFKGNLKESIATVNKLSFYKELVELFNLTTQIRNRSSVTGESFIISPVSPDDTMIQTDFDAVTSRNIALKGLLMIDSIRTCAEGEKCRLGITNQQWLNYMQEVVSD